MKRQHVVSALAIATTLSACLNGPGSPEEDPVETEPISRVPASRIKIEHEWRVTGTPTWHPQNANEASSPGMTRAVANNDALAISGNGDVHVIGFPNWYHFSAEGLAAPVVTSLSVPQVFDVPFAVAMSAPNDVKPYIASTEGRINHPAIRRFDPVTHTFDAECNPSGQMLAFKQYWRFLALPGVFHFTGERAVSCSTGLGGYAFAQDTAGSIRHPYTYSAVASGRSLEVSWVYQNGYTEIRDASGNGMYRTALTVPNSGVIRQGLWGVVEPTSNIGYALVADYGYSCPARDATCVESGYTLVAVSMLSGAHVDDHTDGRRAGSIVGGMMLIDPISHDLIVLTSRTESNVPGAPVVTYYDRFDSSFHDNGGNLVFSGTIHDAMIVGDQLYVSLFTQDGAELVATDLAGLDSDSATFGGHGAYPVALKKSFDGVPYYLTSEGNQLVVRKLDFDRDGDGLLDRWEMYGIDGDHDGDIDYPLHQLPGIDPNHKNIVIELDAAPGVTDPRSYWLQIADMFRAAPVHNPDHVDGITAILLTSDMNMDMSLGTGSWPFTTQDEVDYDEFMFADPSDRSNPNFDALYDAKRRAVRHVIVYPYHQELPGANPALGTTTLFGRTYGLPGAASAYFAIYDDLGPVNSLYVLLSPEGKLTMRASIFAHELGHALGLLHGGIDDVNWKPNYHSVMNSVHIVPRTWPVEPPTLTFANGPDPQPSLVEERLNEGEGIHMDSTHAPHIVSFFAGSPGGVYRRWFGPEVGEVDFNGNGQIDRNGFVSVDLNHDGRMGVLDSLPDWPELDWKLDSSVGWTLRVPMIAGATCETTSMLRAGGWCDLDAAAGCDCPQDGMTRSCGTDVGVCTTGVQTCHNGFWGLCEGSVPGFAERCDANDNDCDGTADEDFPLLGQVCTVGIGACARTGAEVCTADELDTECNVVPGAPTTERCTNNADDDCDGATDEGYPTIGQACSVGVGACQRSGSVVCAASGVSTTCSVTAGTPVTEICGNGLDDDCDGLVDDDCVPMLTAPPTGHLTGSGRVSSVAGQYNPRRVTFRWSTTSPTAIYELQLDNDADFSSPFIIASNLTTTSYTSADIPIQQGAPWGQRTFWRVRSRIGTQPWSVWSTSRYVDVGRLPDDVNGDGFADVLVGATGLANPSAGEGGAYVFHGRTGMTPSTTPSRTLEDPANQFNARFGTAAALADMNGDGYTDAVIGIPGRTVGSIGNAGAIAIYFGSSTGLEAMPGAQISAPVPELNASFGASIASAGDVDGDGYADVWVAAPNQDAIILWNGRFTTQTDVGAAYLYRGGPRSSFPTTHASSRIGAAPNSRFGAAMTAVGDVDGDGITDVAFGAPNVGRVFVYRGGSTTLLANLTQSGTSYFGWSLTAGDFDGDGGVDLAAATLSPTGFVVLRKSGATFSTTPWFTGVGLGGDTYLTSGDIDRDGDADIAVGWPNLGTGGRVVLYRGGSSMSVLGSWSETASSTELGRSVTLADTTGDARADLFAGEPRANTAYARAGKVLGWLMGTTPELTNQTPMTTYNSPRGQVDNWFGQMMR